MIPVTYLPRARLSFRTQGGLITCELEPRPGISLSASKTILVYNVDGGNSQSYPFTNITEFTATHNLGRNTSAFVIDAAGNQIRVRTTQTQNTVTIYSNLSISGNLIIT